ncbi:MAG: hypothetical protein FJW30_20275 [Acidobacteria bacterium]|nr:hypothetical protein [Acidobacteriota bacterium]
MLAGVYNGDGRPALAAKHKPDRFTNPWFALARHKGNFFRVHPTRQVIAARKPAGDCLPWCGEAAVQ